MQPKLFIIGSPSLDKLMIKGQLYQSPGGAGLYTALGAIRAGVSVTLFAPKPTNIPSELSFVSDRMEWIGPSISEDQLPHFEIVQSENETLYKKAFFGAEEDLEVEEREEIISTDPIEEDIKEIVDTKGDDSPVYLDIESVRVLKPGKYELNLVDLFKGEPVVYKYGNGKYIIDLASAFGEDKLE